MMQLRIPVTDIHDDGLRVAADFAISDLRPEGAEAMQVKGGNISGVLTRMGDEALFRGRVTGAFEHACDRCLAPVEEPFVIECTWFFEPDLKNDEAGGADEDGVYRLDGDVVDLGHYAWEEMALAFPLRFVCPDNKPCAGRDALMASVEPEAPEQVSPFAKLKELFPEGGDKN